MKQLLFTLLFVLPVFAQAQIITTIAGNDSAGYNGDGIPAITAKLNSPSCSRPDNYGNVYITDVYNNRIRKVDALGFISTVAGNGTTIHSGDGGPATAAGISYPRSSTIDNFGNIYILEDSIFGANVQGIWLRKINSAGIITTIAGNGTNGYAGDGGLASAAKLSISTDVVVDSLGNIYISDYGNERIRKIDITGIITTIAGNGVAVYVGDGGQATNASIGNPTSIAVDKYGNLYIAEYYYHHCIRKVDAFGIITTIAGVGTIGNTGDGGPATAAEIDPDGGIAVDNFGNIYFSSQFYTHVRMVNPVGIISTVAGSGTGGYSGDGGPATGAEFLRPIGVAVDRTANIYITDNFAQNVRKVTPVNNIVINVTQEQNNIVIYPNPAVNELTISSPYSITSITIANLLGYPIYNDIYNAEKIRVDISNFQPGIYLIRINGTEIRKFVKE